MKTLRFIFVPLTLAASPLHAQLVADGATNTLSNFTNTFTSVTVGTNGSFTLLVLSDNCLLTNSGFSTIGANATAKSNEVRLVSPSARWFMGASSGNFLFIGSNSAANRLVVCNGATASVKANAYLGYISESASNNQAWVTGSNSVWSSAGSITLGLLGSGNQVVVSNGGMVLSTNTVLGDGTIASNNLAVVTGAGSLWSSTNVFYVGDDGSGNRLLVSDGGAVRSGFSRIGGALSSGSGNNLALITGSGSVWSNATDLEIGRSLGANNQLVVSNGASVFVGGNALLGMSSGANSNSVLVTDSGTSWWIASNLYAGSNGSLNHLIISNGAHVVSGPAYVGFGAFGSLSRSNDVLVTGAGSVWSNLNFLVVGAGGSGSRLVVSNGALVRGISGGGTIGLNNGSSNNEVVVTGIGSAWNVSPDDITVGTGGTGNRLTVSNGGLVNSAGSEIGNQSQAANNEVLVTGAGSLWTNFARLSVGQFGSRSRAVISNAAVLASTIVIVGEEPSSTNNRVVVDGGTLQAISGGLLTVRLDVRRGTNVLNAGLIETDLLLLTNTQGFFEFNGGTLNTRGTIISNGVPFVVGASGATPALWDVRAGLSDHFLSSDLHIGSNAPLSQLLVTNGALLGNNNGRLGFRIESSNNVALIAGGGSVWSNANTLTIGNSGSDNEMIVSDGGWVISANGEVGGNASASNNFALVTGSGSVWSNVSGMRVGALSPGNRLAIEAGGVVRSSGATVGQSGSASNNEALVTGAGSLWMDTSGLTIGSQIGFNRLMVSNGATISSPSGVMGSLAAAVSNQLVVTGPGSVWSNQTTLLVGGNSAGNRADVSNGGWLACRDGSVGSGFSANSNTLALTGTGSTWNNLDTLKVGDGGSGNVLVASDGATVLSSNATIGASTSLGNNNLALLTGTGTLWNNQNDFTVGNFSFGNRLVLSNGATMFIGRDSVLGHTSSASSNTVLLTGAGTSWTVASNLYVGSTGSLSRLFINNGSHVNSSASQIGVGRFTGTASTALTSTQNLAVVDGVGSVWSNQTTLSVGGYGGWNGLLVANGGRVECNQGYLGFNRFSTSNGVVVTGAGSVWNNQSSFIVGVLGTANRAVINEGGRLGSHFAYVGFNLDASDNEVIVTGPGSVWTNLAFITLGYDGPGSRLVVSNGAEVHSLSYTVGEFSSATNNRLVVDGGALRAANMLQTSDTPYLDIRRGTNVLNAGLIDVDLLLLTNAQGFFEFNGGTLITRGAVISNGVPFVVGESGATPAIWDVRAGVTNTFIATNLVIGNNPPFNQLLLTNGAQFENKNGILGNNNSSSNNVALIAGAGSSWTNRSELYVGGSSSGNRLIVNNGATVFAAAERFVGSGSQANSNLVVIDAGARWLGGGSLGVGRGGSFNRMLVTNGGIVTANDLSVVGSSSTGKSNRVDVTGAGSVWSNQSDTVVGDSGAANVLLVSNGGLVASANGFLGVGALGDGNFVQVIGAGSLWSNKSDLTVGSFGAGNQLVLNNGGVAYAGANGIVGRNSGGSSNSVIVSDPGSSWLVASNLYVGSNGAFSQLIVNNGGRVQNDIGYIGAGLSGSNNIALVSGPGSVWTNATTLFLGFSGSANQLIVSDAAVVHAGVASVGYQSSNNVATITGPGSAWKNAFLALGTFGAGNRLVVSNGAVVSANGGFLGNTTSSSNNVILVTGPGSTWSNTFNFSVGQSGRGSELLVSDGAVAHVGNGLFVGAGTNSINNRVVVDGGTLRVTNFLADDIYDIRRGIHILNAGRVDVDVLRLTNAQGFFEFNGGTLSVKNSRISNGTLFRVGDGVSPATFNLAGNGLHEFDALLAAQISSNATFTGNGTIGGTIPLQFLGGSQLVPGTSIGTIAFSSSPVLQGTVIMEISKNGATLTNDQIQVVAPLTYGGSLVVTELGPTALAIGDRFPLFSAISYAGGFTNIILPSLDAGLDWTNKLLVDGSFEVIAQAQPRFAAISLSGTNLTLSGSNGPPNAAYAVLTATNVALPLSNWVSVATNQFDASGDFSFTNPITPGELQRYFRIRTP